MVIPRMTQEIEEEIRREEAEAESQGTRTQAEALPQVYTEAGIPKIWGNFQMSKECVDNRQELLAGMMYWAKTYGIKIDTVVLFVKLEIEDMFKKIFNPVGPVSMYGTK